MHTYFKYSIYGTEKELKNALRDISIKSNKNKGFKYLLNYNLGIQYSEKNDTYVLIFSNEGCCYMKSVFDFEDVMYDLSKMFINLKIKGIAYINEIGFFNKWIKYVGDIDYEIDDKLYFVVSMHDYDRKTDSFSCSNDILDINFNVNASLFRVDEEFVEKNISVKDNNFDVEVELIL